MGTLPSGLDELRAQEMRALTGLELESELEELVAAARVITVERARRVAEIERRGSFAREGHLTLASWVETRFGTTHAEAAREVRLARRSTSCPRFAWRWRKARSPRPR